MLAGVRTPRTESGHTGSKPAAVWLVAALTVVYFVAAGALAPSEPPKQDETPSPAASPASSLSSDSEPTAAATEPITTPDAPETKEADEPDAPSAEEEPDDNDGTGGQDFAGQVGIQFGYACSPVGALGIEKEGRPAKCFMGSDGRARWGYDSNRG